MTSLPITSNNAQPSTSATSTSQKNSVSEAQSAEPFGTVLARQIDEANATASNESNTSTADINDATAITDPISTGKGDLAVTTDKNDADKTLSTANIAIDLSSALAAMLQIPQDIKTPVAKDDASGIAAVRDTGSAAATVATRDAIDITAAVRDTSSAAATVATRDDIDITAAVRDTSSAATTLATRDDIDITAAVRDANNITVQTQSALDTGKKISPLNVSPRKTDVAITVADNPIMQTSTKETPPDIYSSANPGIGAPQQDIIKLGELTSTTQPAQHITPSAASTVMSGILSNAPANSNHPANNPHTIASPLDSADWPDEFSQKITWMGTQHNQVAELHLNPPDLGPLNVVLKISGDQATALFTSPHSAVRDAVENALPKLREALADNGIMLGNATVSDQSVPDRNAGNFMNQGFGTAAQRENFVNASETALLPSTDTQIAPTRRHNGMVDTFA